jgi:hypothetical protein
MLDRSGKGRGPGTTSQPNVGPPPPPRFGHIGMDEISKKNSLGYPYLINFRDFVPDPGAFNPQSSQNFIPLFNKIS